MKPSLLPGRLLHKVPSWWQLSSFALKCGRTQRLLLGSPFAFILCPGKRNLTHCHSPSRMQGMCVQPFWPCLSIRLMVGMCFARQKDLLLWSLQEASYRNALQFCEGGGAFSARRWGVGGNGVAWAGEVLDSLIPKWGRALVAPSLWSCSLS